MGPPVEFCPSCRKYRLDVVTVRKGQPPTKRCKQCLTNRKAVTKRRKGGGDVRPKES